MTDYTELVKALRCCTQNPPETCVGCTYNIGNNECAVRGMMCDAAAPWHRVEEPPKWVSVFDDLPRHNAVVVVSDGKRSWDVGQYHFLFKADDRTIWWWKKHTTRKVLWWMYKEDAIPEPPKEDADGK